MSTLILEIFTARALGPTAMVESEDCLVTAPAAGGGGEPSGRWLRTGLDRRSEDKLGTLDNAVNSSMNDLAPVSRFLAARSLDCSSGSCNSGSWESLLTENSNCRLRSSIT